MRWPSLSTHVTVLPLATSTMRSGHCRESALRYETFTIGAMAKKSLAVLAAISLSAFDNYMSIQKIEEAGPLLSETGRNISYYMGYNA